jgi:outer membrane protein OmpA-like peptidoglycan-associated protein
MNRRPFLAALPALALPVPLARPARAQRGAPAVPMPLPSGMSPLPRGAFRVSFRSGQSALPDGVAPALAEIGRRFAATGGGAGRITVEGQASGPANDASAARRLALARAVAVRTALVAGGLDETRVDVRPLGRTPAALDAADILPAPEAPAPGGSPAR